MSLPGSRNDHSVQKIQIVIAGYLRSALLGNLFLEEFERLSC